MRAVCVQEFSAEPMSKKRRLCQYYGPEPSVEEIEGEFWRIVETPDEVGRMYACLRTFLRSCAADNACSGPVDIGLCKCAWLCV